MRSLSVLVGLAGLATVLGTPSDYGSMDREIENLKSRPAPNRTISCPRFFNTDPNFMSGTGQTVNQTTGIISPVTFGSLLDSIHYQLTFQKMNWGRNTWIQHRFLSNVQDLPIQEVKVCLMLFNWTDRTPANEPLFQNRVKISPRVKGTQPQAVFQPNVSSPYATAVRGQGYKTWCVTVPWVKAAGNVKVNLLFSSNVCSKSIVWRGWVEYLNPFNTLYPTSPARCTAAQSILSNATSVINSVRVYGTNNLDIPLSCGTCTPGVNCKARAAGGPKKNVPFP